MLTGLNERRIRRWLRKKVVWAVLVGLLLAGAWPMAAMGRARGGGAQVLEKDVNLDTTLRLAGFLRARGMPVVSTREQDVTVPLRRRTDIANALRPDVFLSLHNNGSTSPSAHGTEVYYQLGNASGGALAAKILHRVTSRLGLTPRGMFTRPGRHGDYYHILREARSTSVLVEGAFVSNPTEARLLADPGFRQGMAEAIGDALLEHLGTLQLQGPPPPGAQPGPAGSMAPPQELRGEARERVLLKWRPSPQATGYRIWRDHVLLGEVQTGGLGLPLSGPLSGSSPTELAYEDGKAARGVHVYHVQAVQKLADRILATSETVFVHVPVGVMVVLDPGHGGAEPGAVGPY